jgi:hypothetical protein
MEATVNASLTLEQYHRVCYWNLPQIHNVSIPASVTVNLAAVISCSSGKKLEDLVEIASLPDVGSPSGRFHWNLIGTVAEGDVLDNGWTRYHYYRFA